MRRRICLAVGLVALSIPASGWAQSSSQAQYQGVAPETQLPVTGTGSGSGTSGGNGAAVTGGGNQSGSNQATGGGRPVSGGNRGGGSTSSSGAATASQTKVALPDASSSTSPFSGGDILWIVLAIAGLTGLGLLLRRTTHRSPAV
jgi:cobalamin biosynthesis Mg chelatase CobN